MITAGEACVYNEWVRYGSGRIEYSGSRIEYLDATPSPGAILTRGSTIEATTRVRYTLQRADSGRIVVWFTDKYGGPLAIDGVARSITRTAMAEATLTFTLRVPEKAHEVVLHVGILTSGEDTASGEVQITYRVRRPS